MSKCEHCGTDLIYKCYRCGAPVCCPRCCAHVAILPDNTKGKLRRGKNIGGFTDGLSCAVNNVVKES